jgi:Uma2 family endonuclease
MVAVRQMTSDEFEEMEFGEGRYLLIDGELIEMPPAGGDHGVVGMGFGARIWNFVHEHDLGEVYNADAGFVLSANVTMAPDVAFVRSDRAQTVPDHFRMLRLAPDLVVEVISPTDRRSIVAKKVARWLAAGVRLLWLVDTRARAITVYAPEQPPRVLRDAEMLDGGDVLPGFRLPVKVFFS